MRDLDGKRLSLWQRMSDVRKKRSQIRTFPTPKMERVRAAGKKESRLGAVIVTLVGLTMNLVRSA